VAFIIGFAVWITIGVVAGLAMNAAYRGPQTTQLMTVIFGFFGAFIGGMLGMAPYIFHAPLPLRFGGLLGATVGAVGFTFIYHFIAKKAV
jgi:uncharacterized membrane protein YeaQ/YmgE (transglycosylase-associated protein family)